MVIDLTLGRRRPLPLFDLFDLPGLVMSMRMGLVLVLVLVYGGPMAIWLQVCIVDRFYVIFSRFSVFIAGCCCHCCSVVHISLLPYLLLPIAIAIVIVCTYMYTYIVVIAVVVFYFI